MKKLFLCLMLFTIASCSEVTPPEPAEEPVYLVVEFVFADGSTEESRIIYVE